MCVTTYMVDRQGDMVKLRQKLDLLKSILPNGTFILKTNYSLLGECFVQWPGRTRIRRHQTSSPKSRRVCSHVTSVT